MIYVCGNNQQFRGIYRAASHWLLLFIFLAVPAKAQFSNGDFSTGGTCPPGGGWTTNTGGQQAERTIALQPNRPGDYWVDLTPCGNFGNGTWIEQAVPVVVGNCYYIEFEIAAHCGWDGSDGGVNITVDGVPLGGRIYNDTFNCVPSSSGQTQLEWKKRVSAIFTATNNPAVIRFTGDGRYTQNSVTWGYPGPVGAPSNPGVIAIDNIVLVPAGTSSGNLSLGNDTTFCGSFSHVLDAGAGMTSYQWSTGAAGQTITVTAPGTYWCTATSPCSIASDTIRIAQASLPQVNLGADAAACAGDTILLASTGSYVSPVYQWSTGAATPAIRVTGSGVYVLTVKDQDCSASDTVEVTVTPLPEINLGSDTSLCASTLPLILRSPQLPGSRYLWSTGLSDTTLEVLRSGRYWLEVTLGDCVSSDSVSVTAVPDPVVDIGADTTICAQFPYLIGTEIAGAAYRWNTGETAAYIRVSSTSTYMLEVNMDGCLVYDTVQINAMPEPDIDLGPDRDICPEQTITLDAAYETNSSYQWNTGETTAAIAVASPGLYAVRVTSVYRCIGTDSVLLSPYPMPSVFLPADTSVCEETPLLLRPLQLNADSLLWSDGSAGPVLPVHYGGTYMVTAVNKCGSSSDTITIKQLFCDVWLPNAFSPNGDGINDVFRARGNMGRAQGFGLGIYNRWGERIFYTQDKYSGWDGTCEGSEAPLGTYWYLLEYSFEGKGYRQKGDFHLIR